MISFVIFASFVSHRDMQWTKLEGGIVGKNTAEEDEEGRKSEKIHFVLMSLLFSLLRSPFKW